MNPTNIQWNIALGNKDAIVTASQPSLYKPCKTTILFLFEIK
jgi:hypothetical protein